MFQICLLFISFHRLTVHFKIIQRLNYILKMPKEVKSECKESLINKKILCVMLGYYVRLAKANNDEFINVKREAGVGGMK